MTWAEESGLVSTRITFYVDRGVEEHQGLDLEKPDPILDPSLPRVPLRDLQVRVNVNPQISFDVAA